MIAADNSHILATALPLSPVDPCTWGPIGTLCSVAKGVSGVAASASNFTGGIWNILSDPVGAITKAASDFFSGAAQEITSTTALQIDQKATLIVYGLVSVISLMLATGVAVRNLGFRRDLAAQLWAIPGFGLYLVSLIAVPMLMTLGNQLVDFAVTPFTDIGGAGFNSLFAHMESISASNIAAFGPGTSVLSGILVALIYLVAAVLLWIELILREGVILTMLVLYPVFAPGIIDPARTPLGQSTGRLRLQKFFDVLVGVFIAKWIIAVILGLAGALVQFGGAKGDLTALGLVVLVVFVPFGIFAFLPVAEAATIGAGLSRAATTPIRKAGRAASTVAKTAAAGA